jgi:hypothetical protein
VQGIRLARRWPIRLLGCVLFLGQLDPWRWDRYVPSKRRFNTTSRRVINPEGEGIQFKRGRSVRSVRNSLSVIQCFGLPPQIATNSGALAQFVFYRLNTDIPEMLRPVQHCGYESRGLISMSLHFLIVQRLQHLWLHIPFCVSFQNHFSRFFLISYAFRRKHLTSCKDIHYVCSVFSFVLSLCSLTDIYIRIS